MPLVILSPHSGRPVKVRDADIGRAIRDESGKIFYVVPKSDGQGYYGSFTRKGSPRDEQRYNDLQEKTEKVEAFAATTSKVSPPVHDATGKRQRSRLELIALVFITLILIVVFAIVLNYQRHKAGWLGFDMQQPSMQYVYSAQWDRQWKNHQIISATTDYDEMYASVTNRTSVAGVSSPLCLAGRLRAHDGGVACGSSIARGSRT